MLGSKQLFIELAICHLRLSDDMAQRNHHMKRNGTGIIMLQKKKRDSSRIKMLQKIKRLHEKKKTYQTPRNFFAEIYAQRAWTHLQEDMSHNQMHAHKYIDTHRDNQINKHT